MSFITPPLSIIPPKKSALGQQISSSCGTFTTASSSLVDVTNLSVSITTTGRPVFLAIIPDGTASQAFIGNASSTAVLLAFIRGSTAVGIFQTITNQTAAFQVFPSIFTIDTPAAGTYTYKVQAANSGSSTITVKLCKLIAFEL